APHHRTLANNVAVNNVFVTPFGGGKAFRSNVFNGTFSIDAILSPTRLRYTLLAPADGSNPGSGAVGVPFHATGGSGGTGAVVEGNRVYGATFGNYNDTGSNKDIIVRNNFFSDVICGVYHSMGLLSATTSASSLTANGTLATFTTSAAHGLLDGSAVLIEGALEGTPPNTFLSLLYNGYFEIK